MDDEEAVLNEILWRYYNNTVIMQMETAMNILPVLMKQSQRKGLEMSNAA